MSLKSDPEFIEDSIRKVLSEDDFTRKYFSWIEDRGLIKEFTSHIRTRMVTSIKGTSLGPNASLNSISPKIQAINLLIAEFLVQQQLHYTFSVFSSEVSPPPRTKSEVNIATSQFSFPINNTSTNGPNSRFQQQDVLDVLETLEIPPDQSNRALNLYRENRKGDALLTCIFNILSEMTPRGHGSRTKSKTTGNESTTECSNTEISSDQNIFTGINSKHNLRLERTTELPVFSLDIHNILIQSNVKAEHIERLQDQLTSILQLEVERVRQDEESKYQKELIERERIFQKNLIEREGMFRELIDESQGRIAHERQEINNMAIEMRDSHEQVARRFTELEEWGQALQNKELEIEEIKHHDALRIAEKISQIDIQKRQLDGEFCRLKRDQEEMELIQNKVVELKRSIEVTNQSTAQDTSVLHDLHYQCLYLRRELESTRNLLDKQSSECFVQKQSTRKNHQGVAGRSSSQTLAVKEMCRQLQQENAELRSRTRQQDRRIEELTAHAAHLVIELENATSAVTLLTSRDTVFHVNSDEPTSVSSFILHQGSGTVTVPAPPPVFQPPPPPPLPPPISPDRSRRVGGGEESIFGGPPVVFTTPDSTPQRSRTMRTRGTRRKPPKRLVVYNHSSSDEASPTEEMLVEARRRLRTLAEESEAVDRRFMDFRRRHTALLDSAVATFNLQHAAYLTDSNRLASTSYHSRRNIPTTSYGFHAEYENSLPSYTRLNSRPYHQVSNLNAQLRTNRMTDLFDLSTQSDVPNSYIFSYQTPNIYASTTRLSQIPTGDVGVNVPHRVPILTMPSENMNSERVFSSIIVTTSCQSERTLSNQSPGTIGQINTNDFNRAISHQTIAVASGMVMTSIYNKPQVSHYIEATSTLSDSQNVDMIDCTKDVLLASTKSTGTQAIGNELKNHSIGNLEIPLATKDNPKPTAESTTNPVRSDTLSNENKEPVLLYSNGMHITDISPSASETSNRSAVIDPNISSAAMTSSSIQIVAVLQKEESEKEINNTDLLPELTRESSLYDIDASAIKRLEHPVVQLEISSARNVGLDCSDCVNNEKNQFGNMSSEIRNSMISTTVLSGTVTSGSVFDTSLPHLPNVSLSSIELSSDVISAADDKAISDDDFWASS